MQKLYMTDAFTHMEITFSPLKSAGISSLTDYVNSSFYNISS